MTCGHDNSIYTLTGLGPCFITIGLMALSANVHSTQTEDAPRSPFRVVWNYPDHSCQVRNIDLDLSRFGFVVNSRRSFVGNEIATLYVPRVGLWPNFIDRDLTKPVNGGIPQLANMTLHLEKIKKDIANEISEDSIGYGVLDQEVWRVLYDMNFGVYKIYKHASIAEARRKYKTNSNKQNKDTAQAEWNKSAREIMERSLLEAQAVRPNVHWGYYLHPQTWWTTTQTQAINDRMAWLFNASTGIYPSIYIKDATTASPRLMEQRVKDTLTEAIRVRAVHGHGSSPIVAYTMVQNGNTFFDQSLLEYAIGQPAEMGIDGVIIWGSSSLFKPNPAAKCNAIKKYIQDILGPYVSRLMDKLTSCSTLKCGGRGRCVSKNYAKSFPHILVKETRQNPPANSESSNSKHRVPLVKRAAYQKSGSGFGRRYLDPYTGLSNWTGGFAWLKLTKGLLKVQQSIVKNRHIPANIHQFRERDMSIFQQRKTNATRDRSFKFNKKIAVEQMYTSSSTDNKETMRSDVKRRLHNSRKRNKTLGLLKQSMATGQYRTSKTVPEQHDVQVENRSDSSSHASQTAETWPDVISNFIHTTISPTSINKISASGNFGLNSNYTFTTSTTTILTYENSFNSTHCSEHPHCTSSGTVQGSKGKALFRSLANVNISTILHTFFEKLTSYHNYYNRAVHQRKHGLVGQTGRTLPRQNPTDQPKILNDSNIVTASDSVFQLYTISPLQNISADTTITNKHFIVKHADIESQNLLQKQREIVSQIPPQKEQYDNYVCQCYDNWQGPTCGDILSNMS